MDGQTDTGGSVHLSGQHQCMLQQFSHSRQQTPSEPPSPDVRGGRWGKSSEGSRACLPACRSPGWGGVPCHHCFCPPGPQLALDGDMRRVRLCCCPAGRSTIPIPDGMLCNRLLHPKQLESPGRASVSPPHLPANKSDPLPPFPTGGFH